jgi:hypothetical protein
MPGAGIAEAEIRTLRPVFCGRSVALCGTAPDADGRVMLWVEDETGAMALRITGKMAS